jgi:hypothetical protein
VNEAAVVGLEGRVKAKVEGEKAFIDGELAQADTEVKLGKTRGGTPLVGSMQAYWELSPSRGSRVPAAVSPREIREPRHRLWRHAHHALGQPYARDDSHVGERAFPSRHDRVDSRAANLDRR